MIRVALVVSIVVLGTVIAAAAAPGDPFGALEPACVPPNADTAKCESAVVTAYAKGVACVAKCHVQRAKEKLPDGAALVACEQACRAKYDKAVTKVVALCPPGHAAPSLFASAEACIDTAPIHTCADSTGPTVSNVVCAPGLTPGSGTCTFDMDDASPPLTGLLCGIDGPPTTPCDAKSISWTELSPGEHQLRIIGVDHFGNQGPPDNSEPFLFTVSSGPGHLVLIGHDYAQYNAATAKILGNAVNLSAARDFSRPIRVLGFAMGADPVEVANVDAVLTQELGAGYTVDRDVPSPPDSALRSHLLGRDVLLIYDQNRTAASPSPDLHELGVSWYGVLRDFVNEGGVVILLDGLATGTATPSNTCELLSGAGLLECGSPIDGTGALVTDSGSGSPIASGVGDYTGPVNTVQFEQDPTATGVFGVSTSGTYLPVVLDRPFPLR